LPNTPAHEVLLLGAVGDHQVTEYSLRVEAATLGAAAHVPIAAAGRVTEADPGWLLTPIDQYPFSGSAYFLWDTGSPKSPAGNEPPREGHDPHDDTPNIPAVQELKSQFWHPDGAVEDVCGGQACTASNCTGCCDANGRFVSQIRSINRTIPIFRLDLQRFIEQHCRTLFRPCPAGRLLEFQSPRGGIDAKLRLPICLCRCCGVTVKNPCPPPMDAPALRMSPL
jgi:hypothetical protein